MKAAFAVMFTTLFMSVLLMIACFWVHAFKHRTAQARTTAYVLAAGCLLGATQAAMWLRTWTLPISLSTATLWLVVFAVICNRLRRNQAFKVLAGDKS